MSEQLRIRPCELKDANAFITNLHRHHKKVTGHRFSISVFAGDKMVGVATIGRPVARMSDQRSILEVTRLCTDGAKNACSALYAAAARIGRELGYKSIQTFILGSEPGTSLIASGWTLVGTSAGGSWCTPTRHRDDNHPLESKVKYAKVLN